MAASGLAWRFVTRPVVRFLSLGGLLFWAYGSLGGQDERVRSLEDAPRDALRESFALEHGRAPDPREQAALVEQWAQDEALLMYARDLRLDTTDTVVRRRLVQDVEFLLEAEAEPVEPAAVRARYEAEADARFIVPERRSFEHVFVAGGDPGCEARARGLARELAGGQAPETVGEPSSPGPKIEATTRARLEARLGQAVADAAFGLAPGVWSAPLRSSLGYHLLRVVDVRAPTPRPFEDVRAQLRAELEEEARRGAVVRGRAALRERYVEGTP